MIKTIEIKGQQDESASSQIVELIKSQILNNKLHPGEKLPPIREMGKIVGAGNYSVRQAFARLTKEGIINTVRGSGTFVVDQSKKTEIQIPAKATLTFGIMSAFLTEDSMMELEHPLTVSSVLNECKNVNVKGRLVSPNIDLTSLEEVHEEIKDRAYDGIIWLYPIPEHWNVVESLNKMQVPIVTTMHCQCPVDVPSVQVNSVGGGQVAGQYLIKRGCKKIVLFWGPSSKSGGDVKNVLSGHHIGGKIGLMNAFEEAGIKGYEIIDVYFTRENFKEKIRNSLKNADKQTSIMLSNTKEFQSYIEEEKTEAVSLFKKCVLFLSSGEENCHLLEPLSKELDFSIGIYPLGHVGKAAVHKLANISEGKFEDSITLINPFWKDKFNLEDFRKTQMSQ